MTAMQLVDVQFEVLRHLSTADFNNSSLDRIRESLGYRGFSLSKQALYDYLVELINGSYVSSKQYGKSGYRYTLTERGQQLYNELLMK